MGQINHSILRLLDQASQTKGPIIRASMNPTTRAFSESIGYCIAGMLAADQKPRQIISYCQPDEGLEMYRKLFYQYALSSTELNQFEAYKAIFPHTWDTSPSGFRASREEMTHLLNLNFYDINMTYAIRYPE